MMIRKANTDDCLKIAELAMMAGEGIPAYFWAQTQLAGENIYQSGARNACTETDNFSYRNAYLAIEYDEVCGMLLAYRLTTPEAGHDIEEYPEFIRPLIELEQQVPDSFYINMLATYPQYRHRGIGEALMKYAEQLAQEADCDLLSLVVFGENRGACKLYQRLDYEIADKRKVIPHPCHGHTGDILLMTKSVD
jgi:ribosomal protein S18 acetylase RimI-like enzyme